jgi:hypothetical protein
LPISSSVHQNGNDNPMYVKPRQGHIALAKTEVLVLNDWGVRALDAGMRADLLEIIDDRAAGKATIITTRLSIDDWHGWIGDATIADATSIGLCSACSESTSVATRCAAPRAGSERLRPTEPFHTPPQTRT